MVSGSIKNNIGIDNEFTAELAVNFLMSDRQICHEQALTYLLKRFTLKGMDEALEEIRMSERKKYLDNIHIIPGGKEGQKDKRWRANVRTSDGKRTQVAANSKKDLEQAILQFYRKQNEIYSLETMYDSYFNEYRKNQVKLSTDVLSYYAFPYKKRVEGLLLPANDL